MMVPRYVLNKKFFGTTLQNSPHPPAFRPKNSENSVFLRNRGR